MSCLPTYLLPQFLLTDPCRTLRCDCMHGVLSVSKFRFLLRRLWLALTHLTPRDVRWPCTCWQARDTALPQDAALANQVAMSGHARHKAEGHGKHSLTAAALACGQGRSGYDAGAAA